MEKWQLSLYWPNVIGVVRGHVQPSLALCVCGRTSLCAGAR